MASNTSHMTHPATRTDYQVEATVPHPPQEPLPDLGPATNGCAVERPPRRERRKKFWAPIGAKIGRKQEKRRSQQTTTGEQSTNGRPTSGSQGNAPRARVVDIAICPSCLQRQHDGAHGTDLSNGQRNPAAVTYYDTRPLQSHGLGPTFCGPSRPFVGNPRGFGRLNVVHTPKSAYSDRQETPSHSSATRVEHASPSSNSELPELMLTPTDAHGQSTSTRPIPDQAELGHDVTGMAPPSPQIHSVDELGLEEDLASALGQVYLLPVMPDPASSSSAPRRVTGEWDGKTQVVELQALSYASVNIADMLLGGMKQPNLAGDRSSTYPGRECSLGLPVSLPLRPCELIDANFYQVGSFPEDIRTFDDASTLVDEPQDLEPKDAEPEAMGPKDAMPKVPPIREVALRRNKSLENLVSVSINGLLAASL
jgi:hypothetical protein